MHELNELETVERGREIAKYSLYELVGQEAEEWNEERRNTEAFESASIIMQENREARHVMRKRAVTLLMNDMPRLPMKHLSTDSEETAILEMGVWPMLVGKYECWDIIMDNYDNSDAHWHEITAREELQKGMVEKLLDY